MTLEKSNSELYVHSYRHRIPDLQQRICLTVDTFPLIYFHQCCFSKSFFSGCTRVSEPELGFRDLKILLCHA